MRSMGVQTATQQERPASSEVSLHLEKYMVREEGVSDDEDKEEEVVLKKIPTKRVEKRAPKAREFNEV